MITTEPPFPWYLRLVLMAIGGLLMGLLLTAGLLTPDPSGAGTHRQLGLPECSFQLMFAGTPCPSCGMTTSWSHLMRGQIVQSARANIGGLLLGLAAFACGPWLFMSGLRARWWPGVPNEWVAIGITLSIFGVTLVNWLLQLQN